MSNGRDYIDLQVIDGGLISVGQAHHTRVDPVTLQLLKEDAGPR